MGMPVVSSPIALGTSVSESAAATRLLQEDWDFPHSDKREGIHSIHPYPGRFIPEIPRALIRHLGVPAGTAVLDPFCGSGVTLVEAQRAGTSSVGIDVNPVACLLSRVKTRPTPAGLGASAERVVQRARSGSPPPPPDIPNLDHWFEPPVQDVVGRLLDAMRGVEGEPLRDALRLALSSILVRVSNQESDTRYAAVRREATAEDVYTLFLTAAARLVRVGQPATFPPPPARVIEADVLTVSAEDVGEPVGLVVTSPPYPNAYEYWLYHKYRMFWLGHDPLAVKAAEIGARAHYFKKNAPTPDDFLRQLERVLALLYAVVVRGGHVCFVIGRSKIHGVLVDNAALVQSAAQTAGFREVVSIVREIAPSRKSFNLTHAAIAREHVLVFAR